MKVYTPHSLEEALKIKEENPEYLWLAGGSDIMVHRKFNRMHPSGLIDIHRLSALQDVRRTDAGEFEMGACLTFTQVIENPLVRRTLPDLIEALETVGSMQVRNQGTVGGNIANASPAGDTLPVLYLRKALLKVRSRKEERKVAIKDFIIGPGQTVLQPDEIIVSVILPPLPAMPRYGFLKLIPRQALAITKLSLAYHEYSRTPGWEGAFALGAMGPVVIRPVKTEQYLRENGCSPALLGELKDVFMQEIQPIDDIRSTASYRSSVAFELLKKALQLQG